MSAYQLLIPSTLFLVVAALMLVLHQVRPGFRYFWLLAAFALLVEWTLVLLMRLSLPLVLRLPAWQPSELYHASPALLLDSISWAFALGVTTLTLAAIFTDVGRSPENGWLFWTASLAFTGLGLFSILAGNLLTLLLAWAAFDFFELVLLLSLSQESQTRGRVVAAFAARISGILLLVAAILIASAQGVSWTFEVLTPQISLILLIAAILRLLVFPQPASASTGSFPLNKLTTLFNYLSAGTSLVLIARCGISALPVSSPTLLSPAFMQPAFMLPALMLTALAALLAGLSWAASSDEQTGQPYWIFGMALLALAASLRAQPSAALAWGIACLLSGGALSFFTLRTRYLLLIPALGLLGASALPLTPAWQGVRLYTPPYSVALAILLLAQALFLLGYIRHAFRQQPAPQGTERWIWLNYSWGLAFLPLAAFLILWLSAASPLAPGWPELKASWPAFVASAIAATGGILYWRGLRIPRQIAAPLKGLPSLEWVLRPLEGLFALFSRVTTFINLILEGEGGVLWTLLLLTLLFTLLATQIRGG